MNRIVVLILALTLYNGLRAQNVEKVLSSIENNNTTLKAYENLNKAQKLENKTGIYLENPEIGFNYLWGDPSPLGQRKDFSISQSFDFPTVYGIKKKISEAKDKQSDLEFELQRKTILYKAKVICNELIYLNARNEVLQLRIIHAENIARAYAQKFEVGEINILDKNKAEFNLLNAQKELENNETEREHMMAELLGLNGGIPVHFEQKAYQQITLPLDFATWYNDYLPKNVVVKQAENEVGISEKNIRLSKAMSLPKFSGGYMSESVVGESFNGISLGMSIPLWENKNKVKLANAQQQVAQELVNDARIRTYNQLKGQFEKATTLQKTLDSYQQALQTVDSSELLKKALDAGELSLIEYMVELTLYYDTKDKFLAMEKELNQLAAGLFFFEL